MVGFNCSCGFLLGPLHTQCMNPYASTLHVHVHVQTVTIWAMCLDSSVIAKIRGVANYDKFKTYMYMHSH